MLDVKLIYSLNCDILLKQYTVQFSLSLLRCSHFCDYGYALFLKDSVRYLCLMGAHHWV